MTAIAERLTRAVQAQGRGEIPSAEEAYRSVLGDEPGNVNALHLLGLVCLNTGRVAEAEELISRAIGLCPQVAELHNNRGLCRLARGRGAEAEADFREATRLRPDYPEAFNNLGLAAGRLGHEAEAEAALIRAIRLRPDYPEALTNLAATVLRQGRAANAAACCRKALALRPGDPEAETTLGLALETMGRRDEAEACFRRATAAQPLPRTWTSLARLLRGSGRAADAERCARAALELAPDVPESHHELGFALLDLGRPDEAEAVARKALELRPEAAEGHRLLGGAYRDQGHLLGAEAGYRRAADLDRDNAAAHRDLAELHLLTGRWASGWTGYEWRWRCRDAPRVPVAQPPWDGSPLDGKTILLWSEPAVEDALPFVRYARLVKARGGRVILRLPAALAALLGPAAGGADRVVSDDQPAPAVDTHAALTSLPGIFGTTPDTVPAETVRPDLATPAREVWRRRLDRFPGLKVGLHWGADRSPRGRPGRSVPPTAFVPLRAVPGVSLISLQQGGLATAGQVGAVDLGREYDEATWADTAAVVAGLDLVIAADSPVLHLAVLGVPVWAALSAAPDWRWLLDRAGSPWYPTARLFRQPAAGNWDAVGRRLALELELELWARAAAGGGGRPGGTEFGGGVYIGGP